MIAAFEGGRSADRPARLNPAGFRGETASLM